MKIIIKFFSEIIIKSASVRLRFIKILIKNIINSIKNLNVNFKIVKFWDKIEIETSNDLNLYYICSVLKRVSGIHAILFVEEFKFSTLFDIVKLLKYYYKIPLKNKEFCVRVKRTGNHSFTSIEVERYIGFYLKKDFPFSKVNLKNPEIIINLEIIRDKVFFIKKKIKGIGGFPVGTQGEVLSLISGGFDSSVSSYFLMNRGCKVNYCFFNIGGINHLTAVQKIAYHLWYYFGSFSKIRFIIVDFQSMTFEILKKIKANFMGIIFKRMMIKAADKIADYYKIPALATGEIIGQVSTQTLSNLCLIDNVINRLILRPIITFSKEKVIKISKKIGTEKYISNIPEYCSIMSKRPKTKANKKDVESQEKNIDFSIFENSIKNFKNIKINQLINCNKKQIVKVKIVSKFSKNEVILDIRSEEDKKQNKIKFKNIEVKSIPFFKLNTEFCKLPKEKTYLLYCNHGIMSNLQALFLHEKGFKNIKIYRP